MCSSQGCRWFGLVDQTIKKHLNDYIVYHLQCINIYFLSIWIHSSSSKYSYILNCFLQHWLHVQAFRHIRCLLEIATETVQVYIKYNRYKRLKNKCEIVQWLMEYLLCFRCHKALFRFLHFMRGSYKSIGVRFLVLLYVNIPTIL